MTVTPADIRLAAALSASTLRRARDADWSVRADALEWDCWETAEHLIDDLFSYAVQLASERTDIDVPFRYTQETPSSPYNAVRADRAAGVDGLLVALDSAAGLLHAVTATKPPGARAHHVFGVSDPEGFAAMGIVETLVHTHDLATGLGIDGWEPPADLCARTLHRLFPDAPADTPPWPTLLWATGRGDLPGRTRPGKWRWYGEPR
ncbi:maleylpyruvate isomerase N-terminal domain-containing protein [Streptomyces sp. NPDC021093]|uniref:maleylpyruvate isomerase N-terminal domain-containing protein n=1 Tax=Streptomyces sp. NPDC021093 TaxID=3365112 RepID=UPI0037922E7B